MEKASTVQCLAAGDCFFYFFNLSQPAQDTHPAYGRLIHHRHLSSLAQQRGQPSPSPASRHAQSARRQLYASSHSPPNDRDAHVHPVIAALATRQRSLPNRLHCDSGIQKYNRPPLCDASFRFDPSATTEFWSLSTVHHAPPAGDIDSSQPKAFRLHRSIPHTPDLWLYVQLLPIHTVIL